MKYTSAFLALLAIAATSTAGPLVRRAAESTISFKPCGNTNDLLAVESINVSPDPPRLGNNKLTISSIGELKTTISQGAKMYVTGKVGSMQVYEHTFDMCEEGEKAGVPCPVGPGKRTLSSIMEMPEKGIPPFVTINVKAVAKNADNSHLFCMEGTIKFLPKETE